MPGTLRTSHALWIAVAILLSAQELDATQPHLVFLSPVVEMGDVHQFQTIEHRFVVENHGDRPFRLTNLQPILKAASATTNRESIPAGESAEIHVIQPVGDELGESSFRFRVTTDDPTTPEQKLVLRAFVESAYDPETSTVEFGEVGRPEQAHREIEVTTREAKTLGFRGLVAAPPWVRAEVVEPIPQGFRLRFELSPDAPLGQQTTRFFVATDLGAQDRYVVTLRATIFGDVVARPAQLDFGLIRLGQVGTKTVRLAHREGKPLKIERIEGDLTGVSTREVACRALPEGASTAACRDLEITFRPSISGLLNGTLAVRLDNGEVLPVNYAALAAAPGAEVRDITSELQALVEKNPLPFDPNRPPPLTRTPTIPSSKRSVDIKWRAAKEEGIYGYLIYRAEERGGPYFRQSEIVRVPAQPVPLTAVPAPTASEVHDYLWTDRNVEPGKTYFYYLDTISRGGRKQRFSGVLSRSIAPEVSDAKP